MSERNENNSLYENSEYPSRQQAPSREAPARRRRKKRRGHPILAGIFKVLGTLLLVGLCTGAVLCCFAAVYIRTVIIPIADLSVDDFQFNENSVMLYQDPSSGTYQELVTLASTTNSIWVDWNEIPQDLKDAAVAIEDERFYSHPGVDWKRTGKAVLDMFTGGDISGGSTITQQLIKNLTNYNETTVKRKLTEIVRALRFTQNNSKDDTLLWYLNIIPLDSKYEGVGAAAYGYFGKPVSELSLAECASLIAITNNPSKYGPYSPAKIATESTGELWDTRQWNKWRQGNVLDKMLEQGMITQEECDAAKAQELVFVKGESSKADSGTVYSWYEETVISDVREDLKEKLGWSDKRISQALAQGGLRIYTCLNPEVQAIAEEIYTDRANLDYTSPNGQLMQSSITVIDNSTGDVAAIVGQFGEKNKNLLKNFANTSQRQPGSSFKPLAVYSPAIELGRISPISVIDDYPYQILNNKPWPTNSGTASYRGKTTVLEGITDSLNTVAVRVLADLVTPQTSFDFVQDKYHIDLVEAMEAGGEIKSDIDVSPLAMGGLTKGVCTRDMAEAFAVFPNNGVYTASRTYSKITQMVEDQEVLLLDNSSEPETVIKDTTAYYMNYMLQNVIKNGTAKGHGLSGMHAAGKTGTTNSQYDRWFVGYTPYYTAAVWTGYPEANERFTATSAALNLWDKVMERIHSGLPDKDFPSPSGLKSVTYCKDSGMLATSYCAMDPRGSRAASAQVFPEDVPTQECTVHTASTVIRLCKDSQVPAEDGTVSGELFLAGPYCPEESILEVCAPNYAREQVGGAVARDEGYRYANYEARELCPVHTDAIPEAPLGNPLDPDDPLWADPGMSTDPGGEEIVLPEDPAGGWEPEPEPPAGTVEEPQPGPEEPIPPESGGGAADSGPVG